MELFKLVGTIAITNAEANDAIDDTTDRAKDSENKITSAFKKIGKAVATYAALDKLKDFGLNCINAASDANAASSQFTQVFGNMEKSASKSLKGIADDTGIQVNRMKGSYTQIAAFAKTTGMDTESSLGLANRAMIAVADSAAFYDRSLEETTESLQSFLKGNYENDAALGLSCTETTRNAAANKLYGKSFNELSESQKQLTLLQMVEDANAASGALGQAARESDTWTNQTGNLKQAWKDFQAVLGKNVLPTAVEVVKRMASGIQSVAEKVPTLIDQVVECWDKFKNFRDVIKDVAEWIKSKLVEAFEFFKPYIDAIITAIGELVSAIREKLIQSFQEIVDKITEIYNSTSPKAEAIKTIIDTTFEIIKTIITTALTIVKQNIQVITAAIKGDWSAVWNAIKSIFSTIWNAIKSIVKTVFSAIKSIISSVMDAIKSKISSILNSIKSTFSSIWNGIKSTVSSVINSVKSTISSGLNSALSTVRSVLNSIKSKFSSIWNTCTSIVSGAVGKLKSIMNFSWSLPKLKLPHISISGSFSINPPSVPHFGISWYKKAMDEPYMFTKPTIFDINPATGHAKGAGEAGDEIMIGKDAMMGMIGKVVTNQNKEIISEVNYRFDKLFRLLMEFLPKLSNMQMVTDTGALVGELAPKMDEALGRIERMKARGR